MTTTTTTELPRSKRLEPYWRARVNHVTKFSAIVKAMRNDAYGITAAQVDELEALFNETLKNEYEIEDILIG